MMRVKGLTGPQADSVHRIRGLMAPQAAFSFVVGRSSFIEFLEPGGSAGRRSQVALDSDAAARRQVHMDDIASVTPRLMEKAVARGSWFVARKPPPLDKNGLWLNFTAGCPPLLSVLVAALHLLIVGTWRTRKALGVPYAQGLCHVFLLYPVNDIPFIACMRYRRGRLKGVPP